MKNLDGDFCVIPSDCLKKLSNSFNVPSGQTCPFKKNPFNFISDILFGFCVIILIVIIFISITGVFENAIAKREEDFELNFNTPPLKPKFQMKVFNFHDEVSKIVDKKMKEMCDKHRKCPEMKKAHQKTEEEEESEEEYAEDEEK